jgi:Arc/MetJ family transcription regulator
LAAPPYLYGSYGISLSSGNGGGFFLGGSGVDIIKTIGYNKSMYTNLAINEALLEQAFQASGLRTENETVNAALEEFIKRRAMEEVLSLFNTVEYDADYDYKKLRGKR